MSYIECVMDTQSFIHVCEPSITKKEVQYVTRAVLEGQVSSVAKYVPLFEDAFAKRMGAKYAVSVNSGGSALFLALWALGIRAGDEVIMPAFTMIATANAIKQCGATPIFVDSESNGNIDVSKIEEKITPRTKMILPVHVYGHPCDMHEILAIARTHKLLVVEDAAEAHGALYNGKLVGSMGAAGCFSFYANKVMTTGEGGMIVTNNKEFAESLRYLRSYYISRKKHFWHKELAWNMRMNSLAASLGLAQLERLDELIEKRRANAAYYSKKLADLKDILALPSEKKDARSIYWMYGVVVQSKKGGMRDKLMKYLWEHGVETRTFFFPMHWQPVYKEDGLYPMADYLGRSGLYLPSSSHITRREQDMVVKHIKSYFNR